MRGLKYIIAFGLWSLPWAVVAQWASSAALNSMAPQHREWRMTGVPDHGYWAIAGNFSVEAENSLMHPASWLSPTANTPVLDLERVYADFSDPNRLGAETAVVWAQAGWFVNESRTFVDFAVSERMGARTTVPEALLLLPFTGNASFEGSSEFALDLSPFDVELLHHREWRLGVQHRLTEQLSVALRLKRLHGFHHLDVTQNSWELLTDATDWTWTLMGGGEVVSSGLQSIYDADTENNLDSLTEALPQRLSDRSNRGWGVDLGAEFQWNSRLATWVQYQHGGSIQWKRDLRSFAVEPFSWELDGFDASDWDAGVESPGDSLEAWAESELEALEAHLASEGNDAAYRSSLPSTFILGTEFVLLQGDGGSKLSLGTVLEKRTGLPMSWNTALNARLGNALQSTLSMGQRYGLPWTAGASIALPFGPWLFFAAAEGHQALKWTDFTVVSSAGVEEWSMPTEAPYVAAQVGVTWRLGWRKPKQDPETEPAIPLQNSTRSPALGFQVTKEQKHRRSLPCALPGGS